MPNWTTNEVTFSSAKTTNIKKIKDIFEKGCPFGQLIKEPNWSKIPNEKGELPITENHRNHLGEVVFSITKFPNSDQQDLRWYNWRLEKWDTKWDVPKGDIEITEVNNGHLIIGFNTAWSPPIAIYKKLTDKFKDVKITWWALDEDDDTNGEGYYLI